MKNVFYSAIALAIFAICPNSVLYAQGGVAINTAGSPPDASALLDVSGTNKGQLMPRLTTAQRNAIANPAKGLFIYNTDCDVINYNAGTSSNPNWATVNATNVLSAGVSISASPVGAICAGANVTFTATPSSGINSPGYQWQVNGVNVGTNSTSFSSSNLNNGDVVTCILSSNEACVTGSPATSNAITMLVNIVPSITGTTPAGFCSGSAVTLGASANIGTINWYAASAGGSSLSSGSSFTVSGLNSTTTYYVDATANGCTSPSRTAVTATFYPNTPSQPGLITGPTAERIDSVATYSISPVANVASYLWNVTMGTIVSGQGSTSITVQWGDSAATGSVSVAAVSPCGSSAPQTVSVYFNSETFNFTGSTYRTITFPSGIATATIAAYGAQGGNNGGLGGSATGTLTVTPGQILYVFVGSAGNGAYGGYNGGGTGGYGGGGGASDVRAGGTDLTNRIIVAGGGGGSTGWGSTGGSGGGTTGGDATISNNYAGVWATGGTGGTQGGGGSPGYPVNYSGNTGQPGTLGIGGGTDNWNNGGGGGGYYGGGSGGTPGYSGWGAGGGGGSGYIGGVNGGSMQNGVRSGDGQVVITW